MSDTIYTTHDSFQPTVTVGREVLPIAIQHGMELWWDGSTPTKRLDRRDGSSQFTRYVNGRIEGKLSEVAMTELLEQYFGVSSTVDWRIYGDYTETDDGDLQYLTYEHQNGYEEYDLGVDIEVKKTKPWNSWLAMRDEIFAKLDDDAPIVLTKHHIGNDIQLDEWSDCNNWDDVEADGEFRDRLLDFAAETFPLHVEFAGAVYPDELTHHFDKGDKLYNPTTGETLSEGLRRPNEAIPVEDIPNSPDRWNRVVAELCAEMPDDAWNPLTVIESSPVA
jgi:hypothetical protein